MKFVAISCKAGDIMSLKELTALVKTERISRREFVQLSIAAGISAAAGLSSFAKILRAAPKRGGYFRAAIGHGSTTDTLDPATWNNSFDGDLGQGIYGNTLLAIDLKNDAVADLVESYEGTSGLKVWVFRLRKGITFHNGKSLTAEDVVASFNHHRGSNSKSVVKSLLTNIDSITADGKYSVVFTLKNGYADFPFTVTDYHLPILPSKDGVADWQNGIGTGPFMLEAFESGVRIKAKRNPNYHADVFFDEVEALSIVDVTARTNALLAGEVDYIDRCDLKTVALLEKVPEVEVDSTTGFAHYVAPMNVTQAPFDNVDVRTALKWAIDRQEIVDKVLLGHGRPGNDDPIAPTLKFATNPQPVFSYDPDKARYHLKRAGFSTLKIDLSTAEAAFSGAIDTAVLMKAQAKSAGIEINVIREADDSYGDSVWMKKPWCMSYWFGRPAVDLTMSLSYAADAAWNDTFWKNPRFNELLIQARAETDEATRASMYSEMQQILHDDGGVIVLMFNDYVTAHSARVAHGSLNCNYDHDGGKMYSRWWLA